MTQRPSSSALSLKVMMLILFVVMAVGAGIAYLLVYKFFPHPHIATTFVRGSLQAMAFVKMWPHYFGGATLERFAIITGISSTTG